MDYLTKNVPVYGFEIDGWEYSYEHDEVLYDEYDGHYVEHYGETKRVEPVRDRPAKWFCVAVYSVWNAYGGPEEGGWYYRCGQLIDHHRIRFFDSFDEAVDYQSKLWDEYDGCEDVSVKAFTEAMPDTYFPKKRPYYS